MTMRRPAAVTALALAAVLLTACTGSVDPTPAPTKPQPSEEATAGIRLVAPEEPVTLGEEVVIIVEVDGDDGPLAGADVTFDVVSGEASYPGGFDMDTTDDLGIATSLTLEPAAAGRIMVRIATAESSVEVGIDIVE